jgi:hypothetical protein
MKNIIKAIPILGPFARRIYQSFTNLTSPFPGSKEYWEQRYQSGGNSGAGSYSKLAEFKADVLNDFVKKHHIETVIEYGCGDGNQLKLSEYPSYMGFDVSQNAISQCSSIFASDIRKKFKSLSEYNQERAQLTLSLDVIYHLIEDGVFLNYMERLFDSSSHFVIIYSSNTESDQYEKAQHVKHRSFTEWIQNNRPQWMLLQHLPNKYPYIKGDNVNGSFADFYIYCKVS